MSSAKHTPSRIVPHRGKITEDSGKSVSNKVRHVLHEDNSRSNLIDDSRHVAPETASSTIDASASTRNGYVLAGEPSGDDVDVASPGQPLKRSHVVPDRESRQESVPLPLEEAFSAPGIKFTSTDGAPAKEEPAQQAASRPCKKCQLTHPTPLEEPLLLHTPRREPDALPITVDPSLAAVPRGAPPPTP